MSQVVDHEVSFSLEVNVEKAYPEVRKLQTLIYRTLGLFRRMGLPENIDNAIAKWQRAIMVANSLRLALLALQAASGPIGWGLAGVGFVAGGFAAADMMTDLNSG